MRRGHGFTLAELLVVLAIIAILTAIAYPSLTAHLIRARRTEAQVALLEAMQKQERYFSTHNTYLAFSSDNAEPEAQRFKWYSGADAASSAYELAGNACPGQVLSSCIMLTAIPGSARVNTAFKDADCQTLTLDSEGTQTASGSGKGCWP